MTFRISEAGNVSKELRRTVGLLGFLGKRQSDGQEMMLLTDLTKQYTIQSFASFVESLYPIGWNIILAEIRKHLHFNHIVDLADCPIDEKGLEQSLAYHKFILPTDARDFIRTKNREKINARRRKAYEHSRSCTLFASPPDDGVQNG